MSQKKSLQLILIYLKVLIAKKLSVIQEKNPECSIGSYPYFDYIENTSGVNIVISSWKLKNLDNIANQIAEMILLLNGKSKIV